MIIPPVAQKCWLDLMNKVKQIPELVDKTESVWNEDDLISILKGARSPIAGLVYEGIQSSTDVTRMGLSGDVTVSILLILQGDHIGKVDEKPEAIRLLDALRSLILTTTSPTGHKWRFVRESPTGQMGNKIIFTQIWATAVLLTAAR